MRTAVLLNRENVLRQLDSVIAALQTLRADIDSEEVEALETRLTRARQSRERWIIERQTAEWGSPDKTLLTEVPRSKDIFSRLIGIRRKEK